MFSNLQQHLRNHLSQLLETAKMKLIIYGKLLLVLKHFFSVQCNVDLITAQVTESEPKYLTENKVYTPYNIMLASIPHPISEVYFSFLNTAHHPLSFPLQKVVFHPEMQFHTVQIVWQYSISFDLCATPHCYSFYKHQPQFSFILCLINKAQAEISSDSRLCAIRDSRS